MKRIISVLFFSYSTAAFASNKAIVDADAFIVNLAQLPSYILTIMRYGVITFSVIGFSWYLYRFYAANMIAMGSATKVSFQTEPTLAGSIIAMVCYALLFLIAYDFMVIAQMNEAMTGATTTSLYSTVEYHADQKRSEFLEQVGLTMVQNICYLLAFSSAVLGVTHVKNISNGRSNAPMWHVLGFFVASGLLSNIIWLNDFIGNTFKINILRIIF